MAGRLTARTVASLTRQGQHRPGRHTDGDGLHLHVRASGDAGWVLRYRLHGRQRDLTLGGYPEVSLRDAREGRGGGTRPAPPGPRPHPRTPAPPG